MPGAFHPEVDSKLHIAVEDNQHVFADGCDFLDGAAGQALGAVDTSDKTLLKSFTL
jgi:hypothetical protein